MKTLKPIFIAFSLLISLPFVSKAQRVDSAQVKFDSTIVKKEISIKMIDSLGRTYTIKKVKIMNEEVSANHNSRILYTWTSFDYTMNGKIISHRNLIKRLKLFESSSLEHRKSNNRKIVSILGYSVFTLSIQGLMFWGLVKAVHDQFGGGPLNHRETNFKNAILFTCVSGLTLGLPLGIINHKRAHRHFEKSIALYNEEIIKRHK
jgi:hypothetical protein